jgi:hypothetical protein
MSKSDTWLTELMSIASIQGLTRSDGVEAREKALKQWIKDWIGEYSFNQHIIKKEIKADEMDFIKYHCATKIAEILMEESVHMNLKPNNVSIKLFALKKN